MSDAISPWRFRVAVRLGTWLVVSATACAEPSGPGVSIVIAPRVDTVVPGTSTLFIAHLMGDGVAGGQPVEWLTSDSTIATIHADGRANALMPGVTSIRVSVAGLTSAPARLVVVPSPDPVIDLAPARASVPVGSVVLFTAKVVGAAKGSPVAYKWETSDSRVALVFDVPSFPYAVAVALQPGVAEITAATGGAVSAPSVIEVVGTVASGLGGI